MTDVIICPACNRRLLTPVDKWNLSVCCPKCGHNWRWPPEPDTVVLHRPVGTDGEEWTVEEILAREG
jgi:hypothetical protein